MNFSMKMGRLIAPVTLWATFGVIVLAVMIWLAVPMAGLGSSLMALIVGLGMAIGMGRVFTSGHTGPSGHTAPPHTH
jgi:hypothetical protein